MFSNGRDVFIPPYYQVMNRNFLLKPILALAMMMMSSVSVDAAPIGSGASPLGVTDFDLRGRSAKDKLGTIDGIGFSGVAMFLNNKGDITRLNQYLEVKRNLKLIAGLYVNDHTARLNTDQLDQVIDQLAKMDATLWLIMKGSAKDEASVVRRIQQIADRANKKKVPVCLYPHDGTVHTYNTAEQALVFLKKAKRKNLSLSVHLCHELRGGNGKRLDEVMAAVKPYIKLVTISGANHAVTPNNRDWSDTIKPLSEGDFDPLVFLRELKKVGYDGPIILHTFGLHKKPATHYRESFRHYQKLAKKL